jgi:hypothetical protein
LHPRRHIFTIARDHLQLRVLARYMVFENREVSHVPVLQPSPTCLQSNQLMLPNAHVPGYDQMLTRHKWHVQIPVKCDLRPEPVPDAITTSLGIQDCYGDMPLRQLADTMG